MSLEYLELEMIQLTVAAGIVMLSLVGLTGLTLLVLIWFGKIDLSKLICEPNGDASTSRLQFLIFTFVISISLAIVSLSANPPSFPKEISPDVLGLLGISGGSYLVSKGIQFSNPAGVTPKPPDTSVPGQTPSNSAAQPSQPNVTFN